MSNTRINEDFSAKKIDNIKNQQIKTKNEKETTKLKELRRNIDKYMDYVLDGSVKQLFLNLTKMQIPFDYEKTLKEFLPNDIKEDAHGNYFIKIGDTKSMFCGHLDTYCYEYKRVWHVIKGNIISTDGTTTLGGDDKAGIVIMIKMIEAGVPGLYYFFRGEEGVTSPTGTWGSKQAIKTYKENFKKYDRCIAFDRKGNDSIITQQMYSECCSDEFTDKLIDDFTKNGLNYMDDPTGMWCDSGVFMETIPECTNISVGYINEHTFSETQDIEHLEKLVSACINIDWEKLPTKRDPADVSYGIGNYNYDYSYKWDKQTNISKKHKNINRDYATMDEMYWHVEELLKEINYNALSNQFQEGEEMYFQDFKSTEFFALKIIDYEIYISTDDSLKKYDHIGDLDTFEKYINVGNNGYEEYNNKYETFDDYLETDEKDKLNSKNGDFSDYQNSTFKSFTTQNKNLIKRIISDIDKTNSFKIPTSDWLLIDKQLSDIEITENQNEINPDDYIDWVTYNWEWCINTVSTVNDNNEKEIKNDTNIDNIFYDITLNQFQNEIENFINISIDSGFVENDSDYKYYTPTIEKWMKKKYSKEVNNNTINSTMFIDWIKKHKNDLLEYFNS